MALAKRQLDRSEVELAVARRLRERVRRFVELLEDTDGNSIEEQSIATVNSKLDPLDSFVAWFAVPGAARMNACRAVCRRAERVVFAVDDANPQVGRYLNRLSDLLFVLARAASAGDERLWEPGRGA